VTLKPQISPATEQFVAPPDPLGRVLYVLALAILALAPTQLTITVHHFPLHPAEPLLLLALVVWVIRWAAIRDTRSLPPLFHWVIVAISALGIFVLGKHLHFGIAKDVLKLALYLLGAVTIFRATLTTPQRLRGAVIALLATTTLAIGLAVAQRVALQTYNQPWPPSRLIFEHFTPTAYLISQTPNCVCSTFATWGDHGFYPSRTAYAGFLALVLPFGLALLAGERRKTGITLWIAVLFAGAAGTVLAGYLVPAILLGLLATAFQLGPRMALGTLIGIAVYLSLTATVGSLFGGFNRIEILDEPYRARIPAIEAQYRYDGKQHLKKFWGEQQSALNVLRGHLVFGVGSGNYQDVIGQGYDLLGVIDRQRLDPDAQNGYLLTAVNGGLVGLAALLALLCGYLGPAWRAARAGQRQDPWAAAILGALVALILIFFVTNPFIRGTFLVVAAVLGAAGNHATFTAPSRITTQEETI